MPKSSIDIFLYGFDKKYTIDESTDTNSLLDVIVTEVGLDIGKDRRNKEVLQLTQVRHQGSEREYLVKPSNDCGAFVKIKVQKRYQHQSENESDYTEKLVLLKLHNDWSAQLGELSRKGDIKEC